MKKHEKKWANYILLRETENLTNLREERCLDLGAKTDREGVVVAEDVKVSMAISEALQIFIYFVM